MSERGVSADRAHTADRITLLSAALCVWRRVRHRRRLEIRRAVQRARPGPACALAGCELLLLRHTLHLTGCWCAAGGRRSVGGTWQAVRLLGAAGEGHAGGTVRHRWLGA